MSAVPETTKVFFDDILAQEFQGELEEIGTCTIGLCYRPGVISFGVWVMCREHGREYLQYRREKMDSRKKA